MKISLIPKSGRTEAAIYVNSRYGRLADFVCEFDVVVLKTDGDKG